MRLDALADLTRASIQSWAKGALHPSAHVVTDAFASLAAAACEVAQYGAIVVSPRQSSNLSRFRWVNTVISNVKTAMRATYHHVNVDKYRRRYLAETQYRLNRRFDLASLLGRFLYAAARTRPCPEHWLRLATIRPS